MAPVKSPCTVARRRHRPAARRPSPLAATRPSRNPHRPRISAATLCTLAQPTAQPGRAPAPSKPHTPSHGGATARPPIGRTLPPRQDAPAIRTDQESPQQPHAPSPGPPRNQAGRRLRQNPHAPWRGGAAGRPPIGRALSPRRDPPAIRTDQESPQQPHGPSPRPLPNRAGRRLRQNPIHRRTVAPPPGSPSVEPSRRDKTLPQSARTKNLRSNPMHPRPAHHPTRPGDTSIKIPMHRGTVAPPPGSPSAEPSRRDKTPAIRADQESPQQPHAPSPSPPPNRPGRQLRQNPHAPWHGGAARPSVEPSRRDKPFPTARPGEVRPLAHRRQRTHDSPRRDTPCSTNSESITPCRAVCRTC